VPRIQAQALRAAGVEDSAISIIPDEQEAIDAALRMGEAGDLLLIFADALARSWKQITKFKSSGGPAPTHSTPAAPSSSGNGASERVHEDLSAAAPAAVPDFSLEGLIRDERGIRMAPESSD
jgi:cyanophycin synthetase